MLKLLEDPVCKEKDCCQYKLVKPSNKMVNLLIKIRFKLLKYSKEIHID